MTSWGYGLLVAFVALGLAPGSRRKWAHVALILTFVALVYAFAKYKGLH